MIDARRCACGKTHLQVQQELKLYKSITVHYDRFAGLQPYARSDLWGHNYRVTGLNDAESNESFH